MMQDEIEETTEDESEPSMRDDFESAFAEVEESDDGATSEETDQPIQAEKEEKAPIEKEAPAEKVEKGKVAQAKSKAPVGWKPAEREGWDKVPPSVQAAVIRREKEMEQKLRATAQDRNSVKAFNDLVSPYRAVMDAEGVQNPMQAIEGLLKTAAGLRMGSPAQKAQQIAQLIQNYGVDVGTLDSLLVGEQPQASQETQLEAMLNERMAPVNQLMQQLNQGHQNQQQQTAQQAKQTVQDFAKTAEFLNDVRGDMADLIDLATNRGQELSIEDAYKKAIAIHPEISQIVAEREKGKRIQEAAGSTERKKLAGSSIMGTRGGTGDTGALSMREQLEDAWNNSGG